MVVDGDGGGLVARSCLTLGTPWTVARQVPLSMGFLKQEYWSVLPFPSLGDPPKPVSPALQADFLAVHIPFLSTVFSCTLFSDCCED